MNDRNIFPCFDAELARLSEIIYGGERTPPLPPFWKTFYTYEDTLLDFKAGCYFKNVGSDGFPLNIAIVFRGTVFTSIPNIIGDIELALGYLPRQAKALQAFGSNLAHEFLTKLELDNEEKAKRFSQIPVVTTGHSLGAAIAELATLLSGLSAKAVTFENPGIQPILASIFGPITPDLRQLIYQSCRTILSDVNIVNTCNPQIGQIFRLVGLPYDYGKVNMMLSIIPSDYRLNLNYFSYSLLDQHSISKISAHLYHDASLHESNQHPSNLAGGYKQYLNENRSVYWRGYAGTIWDLFPEIHDKYKDFSEYYHEFLNYLRDVHSKALSLAHPFINSEHKLHSSLSLELPIGKHKSYFDYLCSLMRNEHLQLEEKNEVHLMGSNDKGDSEKTKEKYDSFKWNIIAPDVNTISQGDVDSLKNKALNQLSHLLEDNQYSELKSINYADLNRLFDFSRFSLFNKSIEPISIIPKLIEIAEKYISTGIYNKEISDFLILRLSKDWKRPEIQDRISAIANIKPEGQTTISSIHFRLAYLAQYQCEFLKNPRSKMLQRIKINPVEFDRTNLKDNISDNNSRSIDVLTMLGVTYKL